MGKWIKNGIALFVAISAIAFIAFAIRWLYFLNTPLVTSDKPAIEFVVAKHQSVRSIAEKLEQQGVLQHPLMFRLLARIRGVAKNVQNGEYLIQPGTNAVRLLQQMVSGDVILRTVTIIPGRTFNQMLAVMNQNPYLAHKLRGLTEAQIMDSIGATGQMPEGRFFPDTYKFAAGTSDLVVLRMAYKKMQSHLNDEWNNRALEVTYDCPYKALIAASIIEKEAKLAQERRVISGILLERLRRNMYLQMDPTLIYGVNKTAVGKLTAADLKSDSAYNTYTHKGLPPTPICMPSYDAIHAAMHPLKTDYLYYVASGDGSHVFSATLVQHDKAIKKYILKDRGNHKVRK